MQVQDCLIDAIDVVLTWDISEEAFADAVQVQAGLMAKINPEEVQHLHLD